MLPPMGVAFVAHCLLNQNSKVGDGAHCAGVYSPVIDVLRERGWRIEQMPCPELAFTGLNRFWAVREQLDTAAYRRHCRELAAGVAEMISLRAARGGRPEWPDGTAELTDGEGIFVEELRQELDRRGISYLTSGETHALPDHDEADQRARIGSALTEPEGLDR